MLSAAGHHSLPNDGVRPRRSPRAKRIQSWLGAYLTHPWLEIDAAAAQLWLSMRVQLVQPDDTTKDGRVDDCGAPSADATEE